MPSVPHLSAATPRLIFPALLGFVLGSALQLQQVALWVWPIYGALVLLGLLLGVLASYRTTVPAGQMALAALALGLLGLGLTGLRAGVFLNDALDPALEGRDLVVTGVIASMAQRNETGVRFHFDVESARLLEQTVRLPPRIYLSWYAGAFVVGADGGGALSAGDEPVRQFAPIQAGERWQMTVRLKAPHGARNPHGFDYELWLWEQGLQATGYVRTGAKDPVPQRLGQAGWHPVQRARQQVRELIYQRVAERQYAGLIAALVVGDQNAIERTDWDVFRATGVAHLMSISGLHITMFAWLAALSVGWLWRRSERLCLWLAAPSAALLGGVLLAGAYALFSGWGVPAQRTVLMLGAVGLLRLSGKRWPWPLVWLLAGAVVVAIDPWALLQPGFWLSFVAVGVLFASDAKAQLVSTTGAAHATALAHAVASVRAMFEQQWVITLALTPLILLLFGQVSLVGVLANALAIPLVTLLITPLAMLGLVLAPLWDLAAWAIAALLAYLHLLATLPFATLWIAQAPLWAALAGIAGGLLLALRLPPSLRLLGLPLLLPVLLWQAPRPLAGQFELLAADVGQGNAVIVRTASHTLLYDAGPRFGLESDAGNRVLVPLLRAQGSSLDVLMLSHRDSDHAGGAQAVLQMHPQAQLHSSIEAGHELQAVRPATRCVAGQRWRWDGVDFEVLHPQARDYDKPGKPNALSCVLRITNGAHSALLTGDIEKAQEERLAAQGINLKSDLLLVPHHGSKNSSSAVFLDAVQPRHALVQAGYRNRFGHPAESVLARYAEHNIQVFDSPRCGAATWHSARPQALQCQRLQGLRYWHHRVP